MTTLGDLQVVPEGPQVSRAFEYRLFVLAMLSALIVALVGLAIRDGLPPVAPFAMFAILVIVAENRDKIFGDETSISGSIAIAVASIVAFRASAPLFGPLACAACAGIYWEHVRDRSFDKIVVNAASIGFSALAGAGVLEILAVDRPNSPVDVFVLMIPVVAVYWLVNTCVLAVALKLLRGKGLTGSIWALLRSELSMFGFALLGGGISGWLFLIHGYAVGGLSAVLLLVFLDLLVIVPRRRPFPAINRAVAQIRARISPLLGATAISFVVTQRSNTTLAICLAIGGGLAVSFLVAFLGVRRRVGIWDRHLAFGVAIVDAPIVMVAAIGGSLAVWAGVWIALGFVSIAIAVGFIVTRRRRRRLHEAADEDERLAVAVELAVLDGRDRSSSR